MKRAIARILGAAALAAGLFALPAISASASASVSATWVSSYGEATFTYSCSGGTATYNGWDLNRVTNGCGDRVWLHQYTNGSGAAYCINPGAVAYGFGGYTQLQVTSNPNPCDAGSTVYVSWNDLSNTQYTCVDGATHTDWNGSQQGYTFVSGLINHCNVRIWLHENANGSGQNYCVSPGATYNFGDGNWYYGGEQVQISGNQAPCSAG